MNIKINDEKYRYDVYQILNIFYPYDDINFASSGEDYKISIDSDGVVISTKETEKNYRLDEKLTFKENIKLAIYDYFSFMTKTVHPWGTLVGIRPTKIAQSLIDKGYDKDDIVTYFKKHYGASEEKALLCYEVACNERKYLENSIREISLYIGMPFCPTRCAYCSFASNAITGKDNLVKAYLSALNEEISKVSEYIGRKNIRIENIYFGGGTPTSVSNELFTQLMEEIYVAFIQGRDVHEFTVEAGRPDSITEEKLRAMKKYGVTRISINPQSMNNSTLKRIGRFHSVEDVVDKFNMARQLGFENINMDIIVGLPGEGPAEVRKSCEEIINLCPESLTVHGMSIKRASKLHEDLVNNKYSNRLSIDELKDMFHSTKTAAEELQMVPYYLYRQKNMVGNMENIGYAKLGTECVYNVKIMEENQTIIALGADAVTKVVFPEENRIERFANLKDVGEYVRRIGEMIEGKIALLDTLYKE